MTLLATLLATLLQFLSAGSLSVHDSFISKDDDMRDRGNQQLFNEEDMLSAEQMGHCPHG